MRELKVEQFVKDRQIAKFECYRDGVFYYNVPICLDGMFFDYYTFQIPIEDTKGGTFVAETPALNLMRWIRKSIENKTMIPLK